MAIDVLSFLDVSTILVFLVVILAFVLYWSAKLPADFPPGPRPFPIVGKDDENIFEVNNS